MPRGPKPAKSKEAKPPVARKSSKADARVPDLEKQLAEALQRETEGLQREAQAQAQRVAMAEILRVISSSPTDVQPVFDAIARSARQLCDGNYSTVVRFDGAELVVAASAHIAPEGVEAMERHAGRPSRAMALGRAILDAAVVHIPDALIDPEYDASVASAVRLRSILAVPMLRHGLPIG